jgi:hypothetical protein
MALRLVSTSETPKPSGSRFLMTPAQHREQARLLRKTGADQLADQCDMVARAIEWRLQRDQESEPT